MTPTSTSKGYYTADSTKNICTDSTEKYNNCYYDVGECCTGTIQTSNKISTATKGASCNSNYPNSTSYDEAVFNYNTLKQPCNNKYSIYCGNDNKWLQQSNLNNYMCGSTTNPKTFYPKSPEAIKSQNAYLCSDLDKLPKSDPNKYHMTQACDSISPSLKAKTAVKLGTCSNKQLYQNLNCQDDNYYAENIDCKDDCVLTQCLPKYLSERVINVESNSKLPNYNYCGKEGQKASSINSQLQNANCVKSEISLNVGTHKSCDEASKITCLSGADAKPKSPMSDNYGYCTYQCKQKI